MAEEIKRGNRGEEQPTADWSGRPFGGVPFGNLLHVIDEFFRNSMLKPGFRVATRETDENYLVTAELPGIKKDQISIRTLPQSITIRVIQLGETTVLDESSLRFERRFSQQKMERTISFFHPVDIRKAKAKYENGLLTIKIPKRSGKPLQIEE